MKCKHKKGVKLTGVDSNWLERIGWPLFGLGIGLIWTDWLENSEFSGGSWKPVAFDCAGGRAVANVALAWTGIDGAAWFIDGIAVVRTLIKEKNEIRNYLIWWINFSLHFRGFFFYMFEYASFEVIFTHGFRVIFVISVYDIEKNGENIFHLLETDFVSRLIATRIATPWVFYQNRWTNGRKYHWSDNFSTVFRAFHSVYCT